VHCGGFRRQRPSIDASRAVVADPAIADVTDVAVVDVDVSDVHIVDGAVVVEATSAPVAALVACADIAESIVDATVVADILTP
jgi:hypothetical protein